MLPLRVPGARRPIYVRAIALSSDHRPLIPCLRKLLPGLRSCGDGEQGCATEEVVVSTETSGGYAPSTRQPSQERARLGTKLCSRPVALCLESFRDAETDQEEGHARVNRVTSPLAARCEMTTRSLVSRLVTTHVFSDLIMHYNVNKLHLHNRPADPGYPTQSNTRPNTPMLEMHADNALQMQ